jgi:hypothetical protein
MKISRRSFRTKVTGWGIPVLDVTILPRNQVGNPCNYAIGQQDTPPT